MVFDAVLERKFLGVQPVATALDEPAGVVCLARIRRVHCLPDGGLLLDLLGIARAAIRAQVPRGKPYCCVQIEILGGPSEEYAPPTGWLNEAYQTIRNLRGSPGPEPDPFPRGLWLDMLCHFLPVPFDAKVQLLKETCHQRRCQMLASYGSYWKTGRLMRKYLPRLFCWN